MNVIDYVYAQIYCWYFEKRNNRNKIYRNILPAVALSICFTGWFVFFVELKYYYYNIKRDNHIIFYYFNTALNLGYIIYAFYIRKLRFAFACIKYVKIDKFKSSLDPIVFAWVFIFLPYILVLFIWFKK
jgi:hypothetical protein